MLALKARKILGENIKGYRKILGLSQQEFADAAGLNRSYLATVERGQKNITFDNIIKIAGAIGVPPHMLMIEGAFKWSITNKTFVS